MRAGFLIAACAFALPSFGAGCAGSGADRARASPAAAADTAAEREQRAAREAVQRQTTEWAVRIAGWPPELAAVWHACRDYRACRRSGDEACLAPTLRAYETACRDYERKEGVVPRACDTSVNGCAF